MILFIDTTDAQKGHIGLITKAGVKEYSWDTNNRLSETLTDKIASFLEKQKVALKDLKKIIVVVGPGHFSRIRSGVVTANTLAFALNIKIVGIKSQSHYNWFEISKLLGKKMVLPFYGKEPNITKAKPKKLTF